MIKNFKTFIFENEKCELKYVSDQIRLEYIKKGLISKIDDRIPKALDIYKTEDLTLVRNHGDYIIYYEYFIKSCWDAMFQKPEYKNLNKKDAIKKLVEERIEKITKIVGEKIIKWEFKNPVLEIEITNNKY